MKVLVLCHGNVNRSALFAAQLRQLRPDLDVTGAGVKPGITGGRASLKCREWAGNNGIDVSQHIAQGVTLPMAMEADLIVVMDKGNLTRLLDHFSDEPSIKHKTIFASQFEAPHDVLQPVKDPGFMARGSEDCNAAFARAKELADRAAEFLREGTPFPTAAWQLLD